jgi:hypothetical protein
MEAKATGRATRVQLGKAEESSELTVYTGKPVDSVAAF